ncbi:class III extradiol dioxygenase subunit B-like domain-containing protein [Kibdelosporangium philippinense]|uniref:Class III extradiol dioxygenase subunit B-like domain-containing protein n=1 Tax=Kibdelosporangium philippinense TaxID=211113 RepID=A0ABS8ZUL8_9PSEU|nr:class III extradiol dioxygenase subunit B-like domain-containing protein [Kibdelosporangium philippinense]MCE7009522.1 class III extradiol dioxygenase subunit B-like domain-containing protein [Kibdelosporangium philippinense]
MIVRAVVVPYAPLLVPELVVGQVPEVSEVRRACVAAVGALAASSRRWIAVAPGFGEVADDAAGSFRGFGVDVRVRLNQNTEGDFDPALPLPVLIAGWLREQAGAQTVSVQLVSPSATSAQCRALGERLARAANSPVGLLVLGDGSPKHGERAPVRPDPRASDFDQQVHTAFKNADTEALLALDEGLAAELGAQGRSAWQVLAGTGSGWQCVSSELMVPFGVGYHVVVWDRVEP